MCKLRKEVETHQNYARGGLEDREKEEDAGKKLGEIHGQRQRNEAAEGQQG